MKRNLTVKEIELPRKNIRNRRASAIVLSGLWLVEAAQYYLSRHSRCDG
mgnify:CR=1 FL=1